MISASRSGTEKHTRCGTRWVAWPWTRAPSHAFGDAGAQRVGERPLPGRLVAHVRQASLERRRHRGDPRDVLHARTTAPLAVVAAGVGGDRRRLAGRRGRRRRAGRRTCAPRSTAGRRRARARRRAGARRVWQASVWNRTPASRHRRAPRRSAGSSRPRGSRGAPRRAACPGGGSRRRTRRGRPSRCRRPGPAPTRTRRSRSVLSTPPTDGCSIVVVTTRVPSSRTARTPPQIASATDSVPPHVNTISSGCAPMRARRRWRVRRRGAGGPPRPTRGCERVGELVEGGDERRARRSGAAGWRTRVEVESALIVRA